MLNISQENLNRVWGRCIEAKEETRTFLEVLLRNFHILVRDFRPYQALDFHRDGLETEV